MKRKGSLFEIIASEENLKVASWKAMRGKRTKRDVLLFNLNFEENLTALRKDLLDGTIAIGNYHYFQVHEPKERTICAASFPERILHHAIMNVCLPVFENYQIYDSYACREGKGTHKALLRAFHFSKSTPFFLKVDIRKYFDSIDHIILKNLLCRKFKDEKLLELLYRIIDSYETAPGKGLPIGNLTSQHMANFYLGRADHYIKEELGTRRYVRYMDDFVLWDSDMNGLLNDRNCHFDFMTILGRKMGFLPQSK
ncbi:MAG: RNA-directed DNA polymerase [Spirochaetales bacterium]|nr:RNA-directed DNA polymerase [Spirochaetales bacterium]